MEYKDYYKTLGVDKSASDDEIRRAFRKLARKYHPDVAADKLTAEEKFKEINEAYEVLGDPEKRKRYDELGMHWQQGGGFPGGAGGFRGAAGGFPGGFRQAGGMGEYEFHFGGTGFSDFFEAFFGGGMGDPFGGAGVGSGRRRTASQSGRDVEADLLVSLEEAFHGGTRVITLTHPGTGQTERLSVKIPSGIREGQRIRLPGKGEPAPGGGAPGDLYLRIRYQKHPFFRVEGDDLLFDVPVQPWEAVLGHEVELKTFDAKLRLKIPPGTQPGSKFRFRGHGLKRKDGTRGDLYGVVDLEIPRHLTPAQRQLWEKLSKA